MDSLFYSCPDLETFETLKFASNNTNTEYFTYNSNTIIFGEPDVKWNQICFVFDKGIIYTRGKIFTSFEDNVSINQQSFTEEQKAQVRKNIGISDVDSLSIVTFESAPTSSTTTYIKDGETKDFKIGDEIRVYNIDNDDETNNYVYYKLYDITTIENTKIAYWAKINSINDIMGKIKVNFETYCNNETISNIGLNGITVTLTNTTRNEVIETKTFSGNTLLFDKLVPEQNYKISISELDYYEYDTLYNIESLGINEEYVINVNAKYYDYANEYFTIKFIGNNQGNNQYNQLMFSNSGLSYSFDKNSWFDLPSNTYKSFNEDQLIYFKGTLTPSSSTSGIGRFNFNYNCNCYINISGNIMSLLYGDNFNDKTDLTEKGNYIFYQLFYNCTKLFNATNLILPATTLTQYCYYNMFYNCTALITAPKLPATTLASYCYYNMFYNCTALITAPKLPATTLASYCYYSMFSNCTGLTTLPSDLLPATTLASYCYYQMFLGCTGLTALPSDLLPATTLAQGCYSNMFSGCTGLTTLPSDLLPATTLTEYCYYYMFYNCTGLTTLPSDLLPATTLASYCYSYMFSGCISLTTAPELPAQTLVSNCYSYMFYGCTSLNYVKCLATNPNYTYYTSAWLYGVSPVGTFIKDENTLWSTGTTYGIPSNWSSNSSLSNTYFMIITKDSGTMSFSKSGLYYSTDKTSWSSMGTSSISISSGTIYYIKGTLTPSSSTSGIGQFNVSGYFDIAGNIMSLLYGDNFNDKTDLTKKGNYIFYQLFYNCTKLQNAANLILPATTLTRYCYYNMFYNCTTLITAPKLPATTLTEYCYYYMFYNCTGLTTLPSDLLPATTLASNCYYNMFSSCTALKIAPKLPATALATYCYQSMFSGCKGLTTLPSDLLPATTLAQGCYYNMFSGCTGLTTLPSDLLPATTLTSNCYSNMFSICTGLTTLPSDLLPATTLADGCYYNMFSSCTRLTTLPSDLLPATTLASNCYYNMFYDCTSLTTAPELPATTLADGCYSSMFYGCNSIKYIKMLGLYNIIPNSCFYNMFKNESVSTNGIFEINHKLANFTDMLNYTNNDTYYGIPKNWTIILDQ